MQQKLKASELKLADTVQLWDGPFACAVVTQVLDDEVKLFRPYGTTADFSYYRGVIPYIGMEDCSLPRNDRMVTVWSRKELK